MNGLSNDFANLILIVLAFGGLCLAVREARRSLPLARRRKSRAEAAPSARLDRLTKWERIATGGTVHWH